MITELVELSQETIDELGHTCILYDQIIDDICGRPAKYYARLHLPMQTMHRCKDGWAYICEQCYSILSNNKTVCPLCGETPYKEGMKL